MRGERLIYPRATRATLLLSTPMLATLLLAPAPSALAQTETIEEVVVTGSRIPRTDLDGVAPVTIYTEADIDRTGATSIGQLLREIPSVAGGAQTTQINNGGGGTMQISLRGMGSVRTLVLLNGRRVVSSVSSGAGTAVDHGHSSTLPPAAAATATTGCSSPPRPTRRKSKSPIVNGRRYHCSKPQATSSSSAVPRRPGDATAPSARRPANATATATAW